MYTLDTVIGMGTSGSGYSDLRAQLFDTSGVNYGSPVSSGFSEIGGGWYNWHYMAFPDGFRGGAKFYRNSAPSSILTCSSINPQEFENADILTSSIVNLVVSALSSSALSVTVASPVQPVTNVVTLVRGDDYFAIDGRSIDWVDNLGVWPPDLTSGSVVFTAKKVTRDSTLSVIGSVVTPTGTSKTVRAEPTSAQTSVLLVGSYNYDVQITLPNGHIVTLVSDSPLNVLEDYS